MTAYIKIYGRFLDKITDFCIAELTDEDFCSYCYRLMVSATSTLRPLSHEMDRDDESQCFTDDLSDMEVEYIACAMVNEWLEPQLQNTMITRQYIGTSDEKFFSQANQLEQLRTLRNENVARTKKIRRDFSYRNSDYLSDV